jgi:hypothetical protein
VIGRVRTWWRERREAKLEDAIWVAEERRAGREATPDDLYKSEELVPDSAQRAREYDRDGTTTRLPLG